MEEKQKIVSEVLARMTMLAFAKTIKDEEEMAMLDMAFFKALKSNFDEKIIRETLGEMWEEISELIAILYNEKDLEKNTMETKNEDN